MAHLVNYANYNVFQWTGLKLIFLVHLTSEFKMWNFIWYRQFFNSLSWSESLRFSRLTLYDLDFGKIHARRLKICREFRWLEIYRMPAGEMSVFNPGEKKCPAESEIKHSYHTTLNIAHQTQPRVGSPFLSRDEYHPEFI